MRPHLTLVPPPEPDENPEVPKVPSRVDGLKRSFRDLLLAALKRIQILRTGKEAKTPQELAAFLRKECATIEDILPSLDEPMKSSPYVPLFEDHRGYVSNPMTIELGSDTDAYKRIHSHAIFRAAFAEIKHYFEQYLKVFSVYDDRKARVAQVRRIYQKYQYKLESPRPMDVPELLKAMCRELETIEN